MRGTMGRMVRVAAMVAALAGAAGAGEQAEAQAAGRVVGRVTDAAGRPVEGARVVVAGDSAGVRWAASTEETGGFQIAEVPPGSYRVRVERAGYLPREERVTVPAGRRGAVIVRLEADRGGLPPGATAARLRP